MEWNEVEWSGVEWIPQGLTAIEDVGFLCPCLMEACRLGWPGGISRLDIPLIPPSESSVAVFKLKLAEPYSLLETNLNPQGSVYVSLFRQSSWEVFNLNLAQPYVVPCTNLKP